MVNLFGSRCVGLDDDWCDYLACAKRRRRTANYAHCRPVIVGCICGVRSICAHPGLIVLLSPYAYGVDHKKGISLSELVVTNNEIKKRYETTVNGQTAYLEYIPAGQNNVLSHTEVPVGLEGQGIGSQLVKQVLEAIKSENRSIIIVCPFVAGYIQRHPEYLELVFGYHPK